MRYLAIVLTLTLAGLLPAGLTHSQENREGATPASVLGIWQMKVRQGERILEFTLELKLEGGALAGKITEPGGRVRDIRNAGLSGKVLRFSVETDNGTVQVEARLEGETLAGTFTGPGEDRGTWEGKRGKERNPFDSAADAEIGRKYFMGHCAPCHGPEGEGGRGVNLTTGQYRHGGSDRELFRTIQNGVPGTEMFGTGLSENEVWRIVAYVRRLASAGAEEKASGDAAAGRVVYQTKGGCAQCHVVENQGGALGPELSDIGLRRSVEFLRQALLEPDAYVADNYRTVTVTTRSGEQISGIPLNEDEYSIQLRDTSDKLRSLLKRDLKDWKRETRSLMPAYGSALSPAELDNLVAYLNSLRRKP